MSDIKKQLQQNNEELAEMIESVNDMALHLQNLTVTENGTYTAGAGYDAIGQVEVEVAGGGVETYTGIIKTSSSTVSRAAPPGSSSYTLNNMRLIYVDELYNCVDITLGEVTEYMFTAIKNSTFTIDATSCEIAIPTSLTGCTFLGGGVGTTIYVLNEDNFVITWY